MLNFDNGDDMELNNLDFNKLNEKLNGLSTEIEIRKAKIDFLKENGINAYAEGFDRTHTIKEVRNLSIGNKVKVAGRIIFRRIMGKFGFLKIQDIEGAIQVSVGINELQETAYDFYKKLVDVGDFVGVEGELYTTQTGELTIKALKISLLSKAMRPLPEKFHGLTDLEAKYRQRYLDLIMNEQSRKVFLTRSKIESLIRRTLEDNGFIEIETPVFQKNVSGAAARPFFTKHNALDMVCNLRIAKETWLKMAMAGGFDRVFEMAKDFRNEGMDAAHLQEFTMIEWYAGYWDFEKNIIFFKSLIEKLLMESLGTTKVNYQGKEIDFGGDWERINYIERLTEILGFDFLKVEDLKEFKKKVVEKGLFSNGDLEECKSVRTLIDYIYKRKIRAEIVGPVILYNYPAILKTLARRSDKDDKVAEVFQVVVCGAEIVNAFSELIDPSIQRKVLEDQQVEKAQGDQETMDVDEDFLLAMEHGMPPMSGLGFGIDRFLMLIFDLANVRDTVLFPLMK
ncbi:MAG: lysine--tRNA ligase [Clostridia bacterium]|nr:lysine--tRNA ligase [Clostridia bacterium]